MKNVVIYTTPTCHFCHAAKDFFQENNISYTEHDVMADVAARSEMIEKSGQMGVPVIMVGEELTIGFDRERLVGLLGVDEMPMAA